MISRVPSVFHVKVKHQDLSQKVTLIKLQSEASSLVKDLWLNTDCPVSS